MDILSFDKLVYHAERLNDIKQGKVPFPVHATLSLGNYCNHHCLWCTAYEYQLDKAKNIDHVALINWLTNASQRGLKAIGYVGNGEPTASKHFAEISQSAVDLGLEQGVFTNGYLIDRFEELFAHHYTYLRVSLDAGTAKKHAEMHDVPETHFPKIIENIRRLRNRRQNDFPTIGIQFAVHDQNICDLEEAVKIAADIGADYFSIKPVFNRGSVGEKISKNSLTFDQVSPVVSKLKNSFERNDFQIHFRPFQILSEEADHNILAYDKCMAGFFNVNVYEDGKIVYCGPHRIPVGTISDSFEMIEQRIKDMPNQLDLSKCPAGCRYHALNHILDGVLNPGAARRYHNNFL